MANNEISKLRFQFVAFLSIIVVLSVLSIFSTLGTFAMFIEKSTKSGQAYDALMDQKMQVLDAMNCVILTDKQIQDKQNALNVMLQGATTNSRGVRAGVLGAISNNCTGSNWYTTNRCGAYLAAKKQVEADIKAHQDCLAYQSRLQVIEKQLEELPPSDNLALFTLISKVSTYSIDDLIFLVFVCLAILLEGAIVFQTFSFRRKGSIASLLLLVLLAIISIGLNMIFWSSLGNFSTGFQIFSAVIGIMLDVLKINFMLDVSDIYSSLLNSSTDSDGVRVIDGHWEVAAKDKEVNAVKNNKAIQVKQFDGSLFAKATQLVKKGGLEPTFVAIQKWSNDSLDESLVRLWQEIWLAEGVMENYLSEKRH